MKKVVYNGYLAEATVPDAGSFVRGEPQEVADDVAAKVLTHPDFKEVKDAKPPKGGDEE